jgi:hypothetical protein
MSINYFIKLEEEFTKQLIHILSPRIYEGIKNIYNESFKISSIDNSFLKHFQIGLENVANWSHVHIEKETLRILNNNKINFSLQDLIHCTLKINIINFNYNPFNKNQNKINSDEYKNIKIENFIHQIYIECARNIYSNPYLFFHDYPNIELLRNCREAREIINEGIKEAIRILLPRQYIYTTFLNQSYEIEKDPFNQQNIQKLITLNLNDIEYPIESKDLIESKDHGESKDHCESKDHGESKDHEEIQYHKPNNTEIIHIDEEPIEVNKPKPQLGGTKITDNDTVGSKILNIINKNNINISDNTSSLIKNKLDIINENDSDTSMSFNPKDKFQEVFSNSVIEKDVNNEKMHSVTNKEKSKFFTNYLNF